MKKQPQFFLVMVQLLTGLIWLKSAYSKFAEPDFVNNLGKTLTFFASKNPLSWYKQFLLTVAVPNADTFAQLTRFGELAAGILLTLTAIALLRSIRLKYLSPLAFIGSGIGLLLNMQFGLASFWTSPASETVNLYMFGVQLIFVWYYLQQLRGKTT
jgi:hypothetical protein